MHKMLHNNSHKFESSFVGLQIPENNSVMFGSLSGSKLGIWVAHGEGKFDFIASKHKEEQSVKFYNFEKFTAGVATEEDSSNSGRSKFVPGPP